MTSESIQVVASAYDGSGLLLASIVPSLDVHKVRVYNSTGATSASPDGLVAEVTLDRGVFGQCIAWASSGSDSAIKKKRKRSSLANGKSHSLEDLVVAVGTNKGTILFISPATGAISAVLADGHSAPVSSISVADASVWSCDTASQVCEWNTNTKSVIRSFAAPSDLEIRVATSLPSSEPQYADHILLSSSSIYLTDLSSSAATQLPKKAITKTFAGFVQPISSVIFSHTKPEWFFASSKGDRNISLFSLSAATTQPINLLIAQSDVESVALSEDDSALAVITDDGQVEIFASPLDKASTTPATGRKSRKSLTSSTTATSQIRVVRPSSEQVRVDQVTFADDYITVTWTENGVSHIFEKIRWKDESGKPISGAIEVVRARRATGTASVDKTSHGVDVAAPTLYNESTAVVSSGKDMKDLDDDEEDEEEGTLAERLEALEVEANGGVKANGSANTTTKVSKADFATPGSFAVILNQALKTNDHALLESCLTNTDVSAVKVSVQRLDSSLAVKLLERLAEKLARAPSRAGQLNLWIKWVMICHGGYLVTLPNLLKTLSSLHATVADRVATLPRLLALQGRLELLNSQMELRRDMLAQAAQVEEGDDDSEDEAAVEYVEDGLYIANGEEDAEDDDDEDEDEMDEDESDEDIPQTNGSAKPDADEFDGYSDLEVDGVSGDEDEEEDDSEEEVPVVTKKSSKKSNGRARA